jgi:hypothetical protein
MPQMEFEIFFIHSANIAAVLIMIYGHETSYGVSRILESIKLRRDFFKRFNFYTRFYKAEKIVMKTFVRNILLDKAIV